MAMSASDRSASASSAEDEKRVYSRTEADNPAGHVRSGLEEFERSGEGRPPWILTRTELKLLGIAGVGFFLDGKVPPSEYSREFAHLSFITLIAYDLFIINVSSMRSFLPFLFASGSFHSSVYMHEFFSFSFCVFRF